MTPFIMDGMAHIYNQTEMRHRDICFVLLLTILSPRYNIAHAQCTIRCTHSTLYNLSRIKLKTKHAIWYNVSIEIGTVVFSSFIIQMNFRFVEQRLFQTIIIWKLSKFYLFYCTHKTVMANSNFHQNVIWSFIILYINTLSSWSVEIVEMLI